MDHKLLVEFLIFFLRTEKRAGFQCVLIIFILKYFAYKPIFNRFILFSKLSITL